MNREERRRQQREQRRRGQRQPSGPVDLTTAPLDRREELFGRNMRDLLVHAETIASYPLQGMLDSLAESEPIWTEQAVALATQPERLAEFHAELGKLGDYKNLLQAFLAVRGYLLAIKHQEPALKSNKGEPNGT